MAIITISRQIASFGDEVATELSRQLGYAFVNRKMLEADLVKHGITEDKLLKYDERKPGFWASLARDRDEYFDYLREAVYERAKDGNCVFIGRGGFAILKDVPGCYAVRLIASDAVRTARLMKEFSWNEKKAQALMIESDTNRRGFHKCFFNIDQDDPSSYHMVLNTDCITPEIGAQIVINACGLTINPETGSAGGRADQRAPAGAEDRQSHCLRSESAGSFPRGDGNIHANHAARRSGFRRGHREGARRRPDHGAGQKNHFGNQHCAGLQIVSVRLSRRTSFVREFL